MIEGGDDVDAVLIREVVDLQTQGELRQRRLATTGECAVHRVDETTDVGRTKVAAQ